jgi:predicted nucleotidyltransferase
MDLLTPHSLSPAEKDVILHKITCYFLKKNEIIAGVLFGSFAEGTFRDIDIGLVLDNSFNPPRYYEQRLERELSNLIHFPLDIRVLNTAPLRFVYQVLKKQKVIFCSNQNAFSSFESRILREYLDYSYYLNRYRRELVGII